MSLAHDLQHAVEAARAAGSLAREFYGTVARLTKTHAATTDEAVTLADRACQKLIVERLRARFPTDGIIGEEDETGLGITADISDPTGRVWVIDPIDGTNNFIAGLGNFCVCIGLLEAGVPVLGVVYDVTRDIMYNAARGHGAWAGQREIRAHESPLSPASMLMLTSNLIDSTGRAPSWAHRFLSQTEWKVRVLGSAALESVYVAAGVAHGAFTVNGKLWDCVAPAAIVLEAGGVISGVSGQPIFPFNATAYAGAKVPYISAGKAAHARLVEEIRQHP